VAGEGALEARATQPQPRVDRVEFLAERFGDLRHAETFDLGHHEHFALRVAERAEQVIEQEHAAPQLERRLGMNRDPGGVRVELETTVSAPILGCDPHADRKQPDSMARTPREPGKFAVRDEKHILHCIIHTAWPNAQPPQAPPNELKVFTVQRLDRQRG
jgi:hypothetical protein